MNLFIPILMLFVPGIIAVSVHNGRLMHITRENWQSIIWMYLIYSLAIVFVTNFVLKITDPGRTVSFSPYMTFTTNNVFQPGFIWKYILVAAVAAVALPKIWAIRHFFKKRKKIKIADDE